MKSRKVMESDPNEFLKGFNELVIDTAFRDDSEEYYKPNPDWVDDIDFIFAVYKAKGMKNSKQLIYGNEVTTLTVICSVLDNLVHKGFIEDKVIESDVRSLLSHLGGRQ